MNFAMVLKNTVLIPTFTIKVNQRSQLFNFSTLLAVHSMMVLVINLAVLMVSGECASY